MTYRILIAPSALKMLGAIADRRVREKIRDRIAGLAHELEKQGNALAGELAGYRSLRAVGQGYRIIYEVKTTEVIVLVAAVGLRKGGSRQDIYNLAKKILRLRLWEPPG